jgi:3-hydroxyacyl-[acyl-carrier-protein] dehydratase
VFPGNDLRLELTVLSRRVTIAKMDGKAYVGDKLVAEAQLLAMLVDRDRALGGE